MMTAPQPALTVDTFRTTREPSFSWDGPLSAAVLSPQTFAMVLVVAASATTRQDLRRCLDGVIGIRVVEASSVEVALELVQEVVVHLVLTDGDCTAISRALPWLHCMVVAEEGEVSPCAAGARVHPLPRPLTAETLQAAVRLLLRCG